ncbi:hypothetical protein O6H91_07G105000 [Diphasiastrum complanatum]|uniref:Uncharacterized protein n=2 Tax=Diphasiastrum complanatum TaxID=34168 RepID=A0ACC2D8J7_DIPCM|nr:hypothetical protein O6H91_Y092200 [Diphasiastrum complanatum]KAJ7300033.1 hypothetical protein O6H91_Y092200 [Diphasiastrum complanatum]KAJ7300034.1 hypothetical protein O6H91_Y092200 [Diphasiastrum complanatum]KAJ7300035.1 hypothetical protein O6H91_Y092200 [Diphasiastrum complanatum]KAJ7550532.1 hypothetical protein O6H91_07G105000 [Diphasiastrum complanatum]
MSHIGEPPIMVEENSFNSSPLRERAEIDTTLPYETVKEAVILFGGLADSKAAHNHTEELREFSRLLRVLESAKNQALQELVAQQNILEELKLSLEKALGSKNVVVGMSADVVVTEDKKESDDLKAIEQKHLTLQAEQDTIKTRLASTEKDLEKAKEEIEARKLELQACADARVSCLQNIKTTEVSAQQTLEKVLQVLKEKLESLLLAADEDKVIADTNAVVSGEGEKNEPKTLKSMAGKVREEVEGLNQELGNIQLLLSERARENSIGHLGAKSEAEKDAIYLHSELEFNPIQTKADLEKAIIAEVAAVAKASANVEELEGLRDQLKKAADLNTTFSAAIESLQIKWNIIKTEIESVREREKIAAAAASGLKAEVKKIKTNLSEAFAAEPRTKEAISGLTATLQEASIEADRAKILKMEAMKEARIAKIAAEQAKAANTTVQLRLQAAYKETEAAKASQAMSLADIQTLSQKQNASVIDSHPDSLQSIEREQYNFLDQKLQEAEEQAIKSLSEVLDRLNEQKATEQDLLNKLKEASIEVEASRLAVQKALQKAQIAEAEKVLVEGELRRWRAENGRRRQASDAASVASPSPTLSGRSLIPETFEPNTPKTDHFAQVLQLTFPHPEERVHPADAQEKAIKKMKLFARLKSLFSTKKKERIY